MRLKQLFGLVAMLAVGMVGCGPVEDPIVRSALPVQVEVVSPSRADVVVTVDYEVIGEFEFTLSTGNVMSGTLVRDGETVAVEDMIYVAPGDEVLLHVSFEINGEPYVPSTTLMKVTEEATGFGIRLTNREDLGSWFEWVGLIAPPVDEPGGPVDEPGDPVDEPGA